MCPACKLLEAFSYMNIQNKNYIYYFLFEQSDNLFSQIMRWEKYIITFVI